MSILSSLKSTFSGLVKPKPAVPVLPGPRLTTPVPQPAIPTMASLQTKPVQPGPTKALAATTIPGAMNAAPGNPLLNSQGRLPTIPSIASAKTTPVGAMPVGNPFVQNNQLPPNLANPSFSNQVNPTINPPAGPWVNPISQPPNPFNAPAQPVINPSTGGFSNDYPPVNNGFTPPVQPQPFTPAMTPTPPQTDFSGVKPVVPQLQDNNFNQTQAGPTPEEKAYQDSLQMTPDEIAAQEQLDQLQNSETMGLNKIRDQAIPMDFLTGQSAALQRQALAQQEPLTQKLARLQAQRTSAMSASKLALERADKVAADARAEQQDKLAANRPIEVGGVLVDPITFKPVYTPEAKAASPIELSPGATLYDPVTGKAVFTAPTTKALGGGSGSGSTGGSGGGGTGGGTTNPIVSSWVDAIKSGQATVSSVPAALKNAVVSAMSGDPSVKLTAGQQEAISDANTLVDLIDQTVAFNSDSKLEGVGPLSGTVGKFADQFLGNSSDEARNVRQIVGNINATIAKARGGTSFTEGEKALLETYTPKTSDNQAIVLSKLNNLKKFLNTKTQNVLNVAGGNYSGSSSQNSTRKSSSTQTPSNKSADPLGIR